MTATGGLRRVAFVIDQRQDFYVSLAWTALLRERLGDKGPLTLAVLTQGQVLPEFVSHLDHFDEVAVITAPAYPQRPRQIPGMIRLVRRYAREVRSLEIGTHDAVVAYSFREFVLNVFIRALRTRPLTIKVRQCNHSGSTGITRRRPLLSLQRNAWNRAFGHSAMRYRWLPESDRIGYGEYLNDPWEAEFCMTTIERAAPEANRIAWPFSILRNGTNSVAPSRPTLVFLGERYPLDETVPLDAFVPVLQHVLREIRDLFPDHHLVFKPREKIGIEIDLAGWEVAAPDVALESLLLDDGSIEKVVSFKSSGSYVAAAYGCDGYLLYPMLNLDPSYRQMLDRYFEEYRGSVNFASSVAELASASRSRRPTASAVAVACRPLIDLLAGGSP